MWVVPFLSSLCDYSFSHYRLLKRLFFPHRVFLAPLQKISWLCVCVCGGRFGGGGIFELSISLMDPDVCFMTVPYCLDYCSSLIYFEIKNTGACRFSMMHIGLSPCLLFSVCYLLVAIKIHFITALKVVCLWVIPPVFQKRKYFNNDHLVMSCFLNNFISTRPSLWTVLESSL